jgi:hypothetical protein
MTPLKNGFLTAESAELAELSLDFLCDLSLRKRCSYLAMHNSTLMGRLHNDLCIFLLTFPQIVSALNFSSAYSFSLVGSVSVTKLDATRGLTPDFEPAICLQGLTRMGSVSHHQFSGELIGNFATRECSKTSCPEQVFWRKTTGLTQKRSVDEPIGACYVHCKPRTYVPDTMLSNKGG